MPGIVGLISKLPRPEAEARLKRMLGAIHQEDFHVSGTWIDESLGVYVGWTALKDSFCAQMPIYNYERDVCLIFSGEDFSDARMRFQNRRSDASGVCNYLAEEYERDSRFFENLNGLFHGIVADCRTGEVTLFNDRYGMHRLCYHHAKDGFYFGAESKAVLACRPELREIDYRSLGEFASFACVLQDRTIFKEISVLPAASVWKFRNAQLVGKTQYFDPRQWEQQPKLTPDAYYQELRSTIIDQLPKYFAGPQRMGIAMTGGLDTRVILASHPPAPGSLPSYTFGGQFRESRDVTIGRKVARICQQSHRIIEVGDDYLRRFPEIAQKTVSITEGTVDLSRADLYLSEKAREIAPAKIVGTYGSEIVRHAVMFKPTDSMAGVVSQDFLPHVRRAADTYSSVRKQHPVTFAAFRQSPWYHHGVLALEQSQLTVRSPFLDNDFVRTVYRAATDFSNGDVRVSLIRDSSLALTRLRSDLGVDLNGGGISSAIVRALQLFTFKAEYAYDYGMPQRVAQIDHLFSELQLQRLFLGRHKFLHFRVWYRDQLADYVRQVLLDSVSLSRPYLQRKRVEEIVEGHLKGNRNYTIAIHRLLTMELLHRVFIDGQ